VNLTHSKQSTPREGRPRGRGPLRLVHLIVLGALSAAAEWSAARTYPLPPEDESVIGEIQAVEARYEETLLDIARRYNVGFEEIKLANPGIDPWLPGEGALVVVPTLFVLPSVPREGVVLNLAEMRLYYFPRPAKGEPARVITHPVSIGRMDWKTPLGVTHIASKVTNPTWYPPESIRAEHEEMGEPLPEVVPPGPDNPLGKHALRLGLSSYLIHGTNKPYGIGMRVSHGCVRMYPEDIKALFDDIPIGTPVHIVNQPVKAGWRDGVLYLEAHPLHGELELGDDVDPTMAVRHVVESTSSAQAKGVRWDQVITAAESLTGIPYAISPGPAPNIQLRLSGEVVPNANAAAVTDYIDRERGPRTAISLRMTKGLDAQRPQE